MKPRIRIDTMMVNRGLVPSRARAQALILAGRVLAGEQKIDKPGVAIPEDAPIRILGEQQRYVSRGGTKLEAALKHWAIGVQGRSCADIGTSTGGFADCLLQHGAAHVYCVDTGFGQIAMSLRLESTGESPRVHLYERTNARLLAPGSLLPEHLFDAPGADLPEPITLLVMDVSFISTTLVLPPVVAAAPTIREIVVLVKPQFEAGREHIGKGGIVRDPAAHRLAVDRVTACASALGGRDIEVIDSPIAGAEGNLEFLLHAHLGSE